MRNSTRALRAIALAACLAVGLAACGSSGSSGSSATPTTVAGTTTAAGTKPTVASLLVLGGAPTCPTRPYCQIGLEKTYGLHFKSFKALDTGGPITASALLGGSIQVGLIFTTDGVIKSNGWTLLKDDKNLQPADNVTPVLNNKITDAYGKPLADLVNGVSAKITTEGLTDLNKQTGVDKKDPDAVAKEWLKSNGFIPATTPAAKTGPTIVVASAKFLENETLADIYADLLEANGYPTSKKLNIESREIYFPSLKTNEVSFVPDYAGTLLTFIDKNHPATTDTAKNATQLAEVLKPLGLTALEASPAQDVNGFVVTQATADRYGLVNLSDLAKPAP